MFLIGREVRVSMYDVMTGDDLYENKSLSSQIKLIRLQASEIRRLATENNELKKRLAVYESTQSQNDVSDIRLLLTDHGV